MIVDNNNDNDDDDDNDDGSDAFENCFSIIKYQEMKYFFLN